MLRLIRIGLITVCICALLFLSCGKRTSQTEPLDETQIYNNEKHFPSRSILMYQPQPDSIAIIAPSVSTLVRGMYNANLLAKNKILELIRKNTVLQQIFKDDVSTSLENLNRLGVNLEKPCGGFFTLDENWIVLLPGNTTEKISGMFPQAQIIALRTNWHWFITRRHKAFWDSNSKIGFMQYNNYIFLSNSTDILTKIVLLAEAPQPPKYHYGLSGTPIVAKEEIGMFISLSDELEQAIKERKIQSEWVEPILLSLKSRYDEIGLIFHVNENVSDVFIAGYGKNKLKQKSSEGSLSLLNYITDECVAKLSLPLTDSLSSFLSDLSNNDKTGDVKKKINRPLGLLNSKMLCDEFCFALFENDELLLDGILMTKTKQSQTLVNLLQMVAKKEEATIEGFQVLNSNLKIIKLPIDLKIAIKDPYVIVTTHPERLLTVIQRISSQTQEETIQTKTSQCPYGFMVSNKEKLTEILTKRKDHVKSEILRTISEILSNLQEVCAYENEDWNLIRMQFIF